MMIAQASAGASHLTAPRVARAGRARRDVRLGRIRSLSSSSAASFRTTKKTGRIAPRFAVATAAKNSDIEPELHPILEVVNKGTIFLTNTPALNSFKSFFWGLFAGNYNEEEVDAELQSLISSAPVVVFAWSFSPFSNNARSLLDALGASYSVVELDKVPRGFALKKELSKLTGRSSVPNVFIRGESVGGCYDGPGVVPLYRSGELQERLRKAGAMKKEKKGWF